ncbi:MAG: type II toxin-antitoxin system Phd/YefM family antitoxin [Euzebyaceae bacterium]|jgi:prevent-host-death family protein|nr:type II toxin-antitoxin system Phd/YefM family antitoxin [Euzebyaceae bacterium]
MTTLPVSEAKARLNELARLAHAQHERFTLTRNGRAEAVLLSVDDLEGLELTLEILADQECLTAITDSLAEIESGQTGVTVEQLRPDLQHHQALGS